MDGWVGGWMEGKAGLRIAYSNQKSYLAKEKVFAQKLQNFKSFETKICPRFLFW
jgi:hypothetical protein